MARVDAVVIWRARRDAQHLLSHGVYAAPLLAAIGFQQDSYLCLPVPQEALSRPLLVPLAFMDVFRLQASA